MMHRNKRKMWFPFFPFIIIAGMLLLGLAVKLLWNAIAQPLFNAPLLTYWQAVGLLVLCRILFGNLRGRQSGGCYGKRGGPPWRDKWMNMSEEEKAKFKEKMKRRFDPPPDKQQPS